MSRTRVPITTVLREKFEDLFPGRALSRGAIVAGTSAEVTAKHSPALPARITETPDLISPLSSSYLGTWGMQRAVRRAARQLRTLRSRLAGAQTTYVDTVVDARMYLARLELPVLKKEFEAVLATAYSRTTTLRTQHLPLVVLIGILVAVAVVDWLFFYTLLMDVQQASPSSPTYWGVVVQSGGLATLTPLAVILVSEFGGRRFARMRFELRDVLDGTRSLTVAGKSRFAAYASLFLLPVVIVLGLAALTWLFALFATHRFAALTSGIGAADVEAWMLALLIALLPVVAFAASVARHDLPARHRKRVSNQWNGALATMKANQEAVTASLLAWRTAWDALYDLVGSIVADANVSFQAWESLVLRGLAQGNQRGTTAYALESVAVKRTPGAGPGAELEAALQKVAETAEFSVRVPVRQIATNFASAEWVIDELELTLQWLIHYLPNPEGHTAEQITNQLLLAYPTDSAFSVDSGVSEDEFDRIVENL